MSEPSSEPRQGRISRWRARSRGTKTMKAGYALAARDVKNWDKDVLARIGSSRMTPAHLARLAQVGVNGQIRPDLHGAASQSLSQRATNRMQWSQRQQTPTRNPFRQAARRISRWRDVRHGTKMVKAAMVLASKEAKNADPNVRLAMGNNRTMTKTQISNMVQGQMETAFKPELYAPRGGPEQGAGQQQGQGQGQQVQGQGQQVQGGQIQGGRVQAQLPAGQPQQVVPAVQQIAAMAQQLESSEQRIVEALAEFNRLQGEVRQLIETRMAQNQQENANLNALLNQVGQSRQGVNQQVDQQVGQRPQLDPNVHDVRLDNPVIQTDEAAQRPPNGTQQQAEGEQQQPGAEQQQQPEGEQAAEGRRGAEAPQVEGGGPEAGDEAQQPVAANAQQAVQPGREDAQQQVVQPGRGEAQQQGQAGGPTVSRGETWTRAAEEPEKHAEQPVAASTQGQSETDTSSLAAKEEAARAAQAAGDVAPVRPSSPEQAAATAQSGRQDPAQRTGQLAAKSSKDTGRGN